MGGVKDKIWLLREGLFAKYVIALVGLAALTPQDDEDKLHTRQIIPPRHAPEVCANHLPKERGRRERRVRTAPAARVQW
jgi:hypothetical protein